MKPILINCDDLGMHWTINNGIISLLKRGFISACSVLPTGDFFNDAIDSLKETSINTVGVHLSLCSEYPVHAPLRSAIGNHNTLADLNEWSKTTKDLDYIYKELSAQIQKVTETGLKISHLDGHMFFYEPSVAKENGPFELCKELAQKWNVPLRCRDNPVYGQPNKTLMIWDEFLTTNDRMSFYKTFFEKSFDDFYEVIIHPGIGVQDMRAFTQQPDIRWSDYLFFTSPLFENEIAKNFKLLSYQDLPIQNINQS